MGDKRYGYFRCPDCNKEWESSHVYCYSKTTNAKYQQDCKNCGTACFPYQVEKIRCSGCQQRDCKCSKEEKMRKRRRHIDRNKPHRSDLCHKCRAGKPCKSY